MMPTKENPIYDFCVESNRIEGKFTEIEHTQMEDRLRLWFVEDVLTEDMIVEFAKMCGGDYRLKDGMDVSIAGHRPLSGSKEVQKQLRMIIERANNDDDPFDIHCDFEILHPFTDGNGRTGRAIWAWQMVKRGYDLRIGFLHLFYYQALDKIRRYNR